MYIRWRKFCKTNNEISYRAEVVEAYREDISVNPRVRLVLYLGSINQHEISFPVKRLKFWITVEEKLKTLTLSANELRKLKESLNKRVSHPLSGSKK